MKNKFYHFYIHTRVEERVEESGPATATATSYSYRLQILVECWNPIQTARVCIRPQHHGKGCSSQGFLHLHNHSPPLAFQEGKGHSQCSVESRQPRPPAPFPTWLPTRNLRKLRLSGQTTIIYIYDLKYLWGDGVSRILKEVVFGELLWDISSWATCKARPWLTSWTIATE